MSFAALASELDRAVVASNNSRLFCKELGQAGLEKSLVLKFQNANFANGGQQLQDELRELVVERLSEMVIEAVQRLDAKQAAIRERLGGALEGTTDGEGNTASRQGTVPGQVAAISAGAATGEITTRPTAPRRAGRGVSGQG